MKLPLLLLSCLASSSLLFESAWATTYYVSPSGSGSECTLASPCSLSTGLGLPSAGDEVALLDGIYTETLYIRGGGNASAHVVVRAVNSRKAVIQLSTGPLGRVWANYVTVRGIVFDGQKTGGNKGALRVGAGGEVTLPEPVHHVVLEDVWVRNTRAAAISITSGEHDVIVRDSLVESTGHYEFWGEAFYLGSKYYADQTVYNLEIYRNEAVGFTENALEAKKYTHHFSVHDNVFRNQVLFADYGGNLAEGNDGTVTLDGHSHTVYNNLLYSNKCGMAAFVVEPEANTKVFNNVVYNGVAPGTFAIRMKNWSKTFPAGQYPPSEVYNNTFFNLVNHDVGTQDPSLLIVKNNLGINLAENLSASQTNPSLFFSAATGDFRLVAGGAAIDQAHSAPFSSTDFAGRNTTGTCRDLGAFEYFTLAPPLPPKGLRVVGLSD
ncbi:MAG: hypothetical protein EHM23_03800 [Acidobacteria bacterium]|nr:MAG: hypothetical protein EHM23_03800 [Acidobacteriota bacterium]